VVVEILYCDFYDFWWGNGPAGSVVLPARWWNTLYLKKKGALAAPGLKRPKPTKKNPKKHLENPPEMYTSQGRHTSTDGGSHSRVTARSTPNNGPPQ
jgi:hypothetical protein